MNFLLVQKSLHFGMVRFELFFVVSFPNCENVIFTLKTCHAFAVDLFELPLVSNVVAIFSKFLGDVRGVLTHAFVVEINKMNRSAKLFEFFSPMFHVCFECT